MDGPLFSDAQKREFLRRMNMPVRVFIGLILLLGTDVMLGATAPFPQVWILEVLVLLAMVVITLLLSMEILHEVPLIRMWSIVGFAWLGILFGMVLIDYLTRGRWPM